VSSARIETPVGRIRCRRRYLDLDWGQIHLREAVGDGPLIVLMHRVSSASSQFERLLAPLAGLGYHVVSMDLAGYGQSDPPPMPEPSLAWYGDVTIDVVTALGYPSAWLLGTKTGVSVALQAAVDHPEQVDGMVLWSVPYFDADMVMYLANEISAKYGPEGHGILHRWTSIYQSCPPELAEAVAARELGEMVLASANHAIAHRSLGRADHRALLTAARQRTLVVESTGTGSLPVETRQAAELMRRARLVELEHVGPNIPDEAPQEFAQLIDDFIASGGAGPV
jgi:pimeloyl-ACP methyl ester carboxylesterase